jgi:hypothetical protein
LLDQFAKVYELVFRVVWRGDLEADGQSAGGQAAGHNEHRIAAGVAGTRIDPPMSLPISTLSDYKIAGSQKQF